MVNQMVKEQRGDLDAIFAAIAHPIRRAIVERLAAGDCSVTDLAEPHRVSLPAISRHLRVLEDAGLLEQTPDGRVRRCALNAKPLSAAFGWLVQYRLFWEDALDAIAAKLQAEATAATRASKTTKKPQEET